MLCRKLHHVRPSTVLIDALDARTLLATFTVSSALSSGAGTLRQAILDSNNTTGLDTIIFDASFNVPRTITVTIPLPQIGGDLVINGPGTNLLSVTQQVTTTPVSGVFSSTAANLTLRDMSVVNGTPVAANGAGLQSTGPGASKLVTLERMNFVGLKASGLGGAVFLNNNTSLIARNCVFDGNTGSGGGAICFFSNGSLLMETCTLTNNAATATSSGGGGGIFFTGNASSFIIRDTTIDHCTSARVGGALLLDNLAGVAYLQNSTFSDNSAAASGGAVALTGGTGALTVQNCTIASNSASATGAALGGGGIFRTSTQPNSIGLSNTIVSGNSNALAPDIRIDPFTTLQANYCAIGNAAGFTLASGSANNLAFGANLQLDLLANNGGPTRTRAILPTSPLNNTGSDLWTPALLVNDQRGPGYPRRVGSEVDIGAFELQAGGPTLTYREFLFETAPQRIRLTFDQNVGASLDTGDFVLRDQTHGTTLPSSALSISYDSGTNRATLTVVGFPGGVLPDARYQLTTIAAGITNPAGVPLPANNQFDFHSLIGDVNHDAVVNFDDLLTLTQSYGQTGKTFSQGNIDYSADGLVGFDDLLKLSQRYGTSLIRASTPESTPKTRVKHGNLVEAFGSDTF